MIISEAFPFVLDGRAAAMYVLRNDGYCWGRVVFCDERRPQLDVSTARDWYSATDDVAAERFIAKARRGGAEAITGAPL